MSNKLAGKFKITGWDEMPTTKDDGGIKQSHAKITLDYSGGIEGSSHLQYLMLYQADGKFHFTGFGIVTGTVDGRTGSFVLHHVGRFESGMVQGRYSVVPDSGTGELARLSGSGVFKGKGGEGEYFVDFSA